MDGQAIVKCVDTDQTPPSPVLTLFADVLFHRTLKTPYYTYLRFVVAIFQSHLPLNICIGFVNTELNYREFYPLACEICRVDSNIGMTMSENFILFHPHLLRH